MKLHTLMIATALTFAACDSGTDPSGSAEQEPKQDEVGTLALNLVGADSDGRAYRLRSAEFLITSYYNDPFPIPTDGGSQYFEQTVSSEDNLDSARITLKVVPGYYNISLSTPDWYLERNEAGTWERVEQAVLLSSAYQYAYVYNQAVVGVNFRFGVDGQLIDFRSGELSIGIEIEQPGEGPGDAGFPGGGVIGGLFGGGVVGGFTGGGIMGGGPGGTTGGVQVDAGIE